MNFAQRTVLAIGVVVVLGIVLFPPWIYVYHYEPPVHLVNGGETDQHRERPAGYHAIWGRHVPTDPASLGHLFSISADRVYLGYFSMRLDKDRLWIQLVGAVIITALLCALLKTRK